MMPECTEIAVPSPTHTLYSTGLFVFKSAGLSLKFPAVNIGSIWLTSAGNHHCWGRACCRVTATTAKTRSEHLPPYTIRSGTIQFHVLGDTCRPFHPQHAGRPLPQRPSTTALPSKVGPGGGRDFGLGKFTFQRNICCYFQGKWRFCVLDHVEGVVWTVKPHLCMHCHPF